MSVTNVNGRYDNYMVVFAPLMTNAGSFKKCLHFYNPHNKHIVLIIVF